MHRSPGRDKNPKDTGDGAKPNGRRSCAFLHLALDNRAPRSQNVTTHQILKSTLGYEPKHNQMDEATMTTGTVTTGIAHIGLTVPDINLSRDFFVNCLGWKQVGEKPEYPAVFVSDSLITLTLWEVKDKVNLVNFDRKTNVGLHHLALRVPSESALEEVFDRASRWPGVRVEFAPQLLGAGPSKHAMLYEPGGLRLEFNFNPSKPN